MLRLMLTGVGLGVISGSALKVVAPKIEQGQLSLPSWLSPTGSQSTSASADAQSTKAAASSKKQTWGNNLGRFEAKREVTALSARWSQLAAQEKDLKVSAFMPVSYTHLTLPTICSV